MRLAMERNEYKAEIEKKLAKLIDAFCPILYEDDEIFLKNMEGRNLAGDDVRLYQHWEWTQGVGLYGLWKLFEKTREKKYLEVLVHRACRQEALDALRSFLEQTAKVIKPGGRLAVITYHSLEDRMVKNFMRTGNVEGRENKDLFGRSDAPFRLAGSKPVVPDAEEVERNPRSRSAKLRVAVRNAW